MSRVVLEAAILGRVVRRRDDDAVGKVILATTVVNQNGSRDDRGRSYSVTLLYDGVHIVRGQHLESGALRGCRERVGVFPHVERTVGSLLSTVVADRLGDRQNVRFGECAVEGRAAVSAGAETDELVGILQIGMALEIRRLQASYVDQHLLGSGLACEWGNCGFARSRRG